MEGSRARIPKEARKPVPLLDPARVCDARLLKRAARVCTLQHTAPRHTKQVPRAVHTKIVHGSHAALSNAA